MRLIRKLLIISLIVMVSGAALIWYLFEYTDRVPRDVVKHIENVWHGYDRLDGGKTPGELLRHAEKRLSGHTRLEIVFLPILHLIQRQVERPVPENLPTLGKGQQAASLPPNTNSSMRLLVSTTDELKQAIENAKAGQVIELLPGRYRITQKLNMRYGGTQEQPIVVRAGVPGRVFIDSNSEVGFHITQPYWVFENLNIKGVCSEDRYCEHAFHVVGKAAHTTIRNNHIEDFNAHIKVNGQNGDWPDDGLLEFNTITNNHRRETHYPVTPFDLVGASRWRVADNIVSNFVKGDGDNVSYGIFMKGAGREGRIERNLVICTPKDISQTGVRVGISFGGGGTGKAFCRDRECKAEHTAGIASNNIVAHCNDFGIDVFRSRQITLAHNTLINTAGIDVRVEPASARVYGNLMEGRIRTRHGGQIKSEMNEIVTMAAAHQAPDQLELSWQKMPETIPSLLTVPDDFCKRPRPDGTLPGAFEKKGGACIEK